MRPSSTVAGAGSVSAMVARAGKKRRSSRGLKALRGAAPLAVPVGPYPLTIGRERITDERAAMEAATPGEPILHTPNEITDADFDGWVQERGLYYAEKWDDRYRPIFRSHDPDEPPLLGGMLVADYGRGRYV